MQGILKMSCIYIENQYFVQPVIRIKSKTTLWYPIKLY